MPRVNLTQDDRQNRFFLGMIADYKTRSHITNESLAKGLGLSIQSFYRRLKDPSSFTLGELRNLRIRLKIPKEEMPLPGDN